ncbi:nucleotidyltransferase substrate binding protein [candidate division TA06 bacterium]|uniref:Nucleotidyltransferase substrate binding protein n=1 Tax=candidate division TA06 bacterium TaxID=2250710 RepID=A0A933IBM4_UNCT6|nr:nucleotidyltransferase substrate binding protein [candidate division TA06 bacterium]
MNKFKLVFEDYKKAVAQLQQALSRKSDDELLQAGCLKYFEFCFELAWKSIKEAAAEEGLPECFSPKACLKQAFALGWITDEKAWLSMLEARNLMSHTYQAEQALQVYKKLSLYLDELKALQKALSKLNE